MTCYNKFLEFHSKPLINYPQTINSFFTYLQNTYPEINTTTIKFSINLTYKETHILLPNEPLNKAHKYIDIYSCPSYFLNFPLLSILTGNIASINARGLNTITKQNSIHSLINHYSLDVLGISETRLSPKSAKYCNPLPRQYNVWWDCDPEQHNSAGVGLILSPFLSKHVQKITASKGRYIAANLFFPNRIKLCIIQVYSPATSDPAIITPIHNDLITFINQSLHKNYSIIIMGDFNSDPTNVYPIISSSRPCPTKHRVIYHLMTKNFIDIATLFSDNPSYTWSNGSHSSRIDQIWMSPSISLTPISFDTLDITSFFNADHKLILCSLDLSIFCSHPTTHTIKTSLHSRKIFNYSATTSEQWKLFAEGVDLMIKASEINTLCKETPSLDNINSIWKELSSIIITVANKNLPTKKISPQNTPHRPLAHTPLFKHHRKIAHLLSSLHSFKKTTPSHSKWYKTFLSIKSITSSHNFTFPNFVPFNPTNLNEIIKATKDFTNLLKQTCLIEERNFINKQISENIKKRCNNLKDNPTRMLSSILEREHRRIDLNKVLITTEDGSQHLSSHPDDVKTYTRSHFSKISSSPQSPPHHLWNEWSLHYQPPNHINPEWYCSVMSPISIEELGDTILDLPSKKATGPSTISNEMLKHLSTQTKEILLSLFNKCLITSCIPNAWKQGIIYPIPKSQEWHYQLTHTRPITLLECTRKCFYKIITKRLSNILLKYPILAGHNFAGLPGKSCREPIYIINAVMEHARESKRECWILSQDMSKAFDLINREMLDKAMIRLHFPKQLRQILLTAFKDRTNQIITDYGLTDSYPLDNGVDQGEVFSPLMWCIYYDPLLTYIQSKPDLGYIIHNDLPSDLTTYPYTFNTEYVTIADVAFMDDTT